MTHWKPFRSPSVVARFVALPLLTGLLVVFGCAAPDDQASGGSADGPFDLLIWDGRVIDGTGAPWFRADVAVTDGRIAAVGDLEGADAARTIDAGELVVTPGFIDMHTHSELSLIRDGRGLSKIRQGVTTEVVGESSSVAPFREGMEGGRWGVTPDWETLDGYFRRLESQGTSGNLMSYVAASQLRRYVIGAEHREPTPEELEEMKRLLAREMENGALGLVSRLETPGQPESSAARPDTDELVELARVVADYGGIYGSHIRYQDDRLVEGIEEAAEIGERAGLPVEMFHFKSAGYPVRGRLHEGLEAIERARAAGVDIAADIYPYIAAAHGLDTEVPAWVHEGGTERFLERLADPELRPRIKREVTEYMTTKYYNENEGTRGFDAVIVSSVGHDAERYVGKTIGEIARERGDDDPADTVLDLLLEQDNEVSVVMFYMSEEDVTAGLQHPLVSICSDGTAVSPEFGGQPHPRYYGTFPRILGRYVREMGALPLEEAVRKMTSFPAGRLGLLDRGIVRQGMWADLVVFDPERIIDNATFSDPHQFPDGIPYVVVNGEVVVDGGEHTGTLPGRALRGAGWSGAR